MPDIDEKEIDKLIKLCRIACSEKEKEELTGHLRTILAYVAEIEKLDLSRTAPCYHVQETLSSVMREDIPGETLPRALFLANAPLHVGGLIRVPLVLQKN